MMAWFVLLASDNALVRYVRFLTEKDPFWHLYEPTWFDVFVLVPYFAILLTLSFYGLHRYKMIYLYKRHAGRRPPEPAAVREWPTVTIQLPLFNEKYVVERLIETVAALDYPREKLEIQVLDDSTDDTVEIARACVERHAATGLNINYLHRAHRTGYKAGALEEGLRVAKGE
ncbi:MAG: glycosyltransferase, partial [Candidatus Acidiferrales bacterium]